MMERRMGKPGRRVRLALILVGVLAAFRIALPYAIEAYADRTLKGLKDYDGNVGDVDVSLLRGGLVLKGIKVVKENFEAPAAFFTADAMAASVDWAALLKGTLVGKVAVQSPKLNFIAGPTPEKAQTAIGKDWLQAVKRLFPIRIARFEVYDGEIRFQNPQNTPKIDVAMDRIYMSANQISNRDRTGKALPSSVDAAGRALRSGRFAMHMDFDPLQKTPTLALSTSLKNLPLKDLNPYLRSLAGIDVQKGSLSVYSEVSAKKGKYEGYVKPFVENLDVIDLKKEDLSFFQAIKEGLAGAVGQVLKNKPRDELATLVPFSGSFDQVDVDLWTASGFLLRNAFVQAIRQGFRRPRAGEKRK